MEHELYEQTNGVCMGSSLGSTFANFYIYVPMENFTLNNNSEMPTISSTDVRFKSQ